MTKLERTTFEVSRASEYFDARQLSTLTGVAQTEFASVCLKELVDNALDACETAGVAPEVRVEVEKDVKTLRLTVSDNGPGIPPEVVKKVLDYSIRVSDKAAYRSPTRGAQGNALKTVVGIPYALGGRDPLDQELATKLIQRLASEASQPAAAVSQAPPDAESAASQAPPSLLEELTPRELEVLGLVARRKTNQKIAESLFITRATAKVHVRHIIAKLGVSDRTQAVVRAFELGLAPHPRSGP